MSPRRADIRADQSRRYKQNKHEGDLLTPQRRVMGRVRNSARALQHVFEEGGYLWIDLIEYIQESQKVAVESETINFGDGVNMRYIINTYVMKRLLLSERNNKY